MKIRKLFIPVGALALALSVSMAAAQPGGGGPCGGNGPAKADVTERWERMQQYRTQRLESLEADLDLRAEQQAAWDRFAETAATMGPPDRQRMRAAMAEGSSPDMLRNRASLMAERAARMSAMAEAAGQLYEVLDEEQRGIMDQHFRGGGLGGCGPRE
jgi:hypothetical protein